MTNVIRSIGCVIGAHTWESMSDDVYLDQLSIHLGVPIEPGVRRCTCCGLIQELDVIYTDPIGYYAEWRAVAKPTVVQNEK